MGEQPARRATGDSLLALYDEALPAVYGYLLARCRQRQTAEDLTAETFLAAVDAIGRDAVDHLTIGWLVGVSRHKLADHWRRTAREEAKARAVQDPPDSATDDPWDAELDRRGRRLSLRCAPEIGVVAPTAGAAAVSLMPEVEDADETLARAGGRRDREPYDGHGARSAWMIDPFGHRWGLHSPLRG